ncbi:radical SAM protein [Sporomusa sp.]|uniref:radical SAM protein n=1 Tax=Sporomusa sp. TaxID=2078658 RepID=UPI002CE8F71F|nr:radical SAM protein [Sporomusa sp.]HWR41984.1 radical SAM protein [Sporomusa sp.]
MWKMSAGTACVVGNKYLKTDVLPTTAYIMLGKRCRNNCRFCSQSRDSSARTDMLSRVTWPEVPAQEAAEVIGRAFRDGRLKRACLQVVKGSESWQASVDALAALTRESAVPVCVSSAIETVEQAQVLVDQGADRICIALDAATAELYKEVKGGNFEKRRELLYQCAAELPGRVSTHLIAGLGETEEEIITAIADCLDKGIGVGLFAFTPVRGTAWADKEPPDIGQYRRIQIAHFLLKKGLSRGDFTYQDGTLIAISLPDKELGLLLADGKAFETSGCPDCNRPYYNERPGGIMYNYPRALTHIETKQAMMQSGLCQGEGSFDITGNENRQEPAS